jgi:hypothetical protein
MGGFNLVKLALIRVGHPNQEQIMRPAQGEVRRQCLANVCDAQFLRHSLRFLPFGYLRRCLRYAVNAWLVGSIKLAHVFKLNY